MEKEEFIFNWQNVDLTISVNKDGKFFGKKDKKIHVLKNITGYAKSGECLAIMGSSGAGKSTLLNILADWFKVESNMVLGGKVCINKEPF